MQPCNFDGILYQLLPLNFFTRFSPEDPFQRNFKGKLHSKIISSDMKDFFRRIRWWRSEVEIRTGRRSNRRSKMAEKSRVTTPRGRHESLVPGVSSSRLRPDSDQSRMWCRARPWLVCDSLNELTWVSFVVHWHLTIIFFLSWYTNIVVHWHLTIFFLFFCRFVSFVWQDSDRVQSVTQGSSTWYSGRTSMLSSDSWLIDISERSPDPNPMHRSSLF